MMQLNTFSQCGGRRREKEKKEEKKPEKYFSDTIH